MGTTTGVGFVPTPTQVEEYTHRLTGNKTGTVYTHTHTHTLDVRSRQPPEPTGSTPEETNRGSGAACYSDGEVRDGARGVRRRARVMRGRLNARSSNARTLRASVMALPRAGSEGGCAGAHR